MSQPLRTVRGMHDILPQETPAWQWFEDCVRTLMAAYGYCEIRTPVLERTELFRRSIGEVTDIVEKEMYTFTDRNGDSLSLRPEQTASVVRAAIEHGLLHNRVQRMWYMGPMFRHERPQKGRYRQFHQVGIEAFGISGPEIDIELLLLSRRLWQMLGLSEYVTLEINSLGSPTSRRAYRETLVGHFERHEDLLDEDERRRLRENPLRLLDSKNPALREVIDDAPSLSESLDDAARAHFEAVLAGLDEAGIDYRLNPRLVRGLDYYTDTVFEWTTERLGAQGTVCAGGRYDGLVEQLGGRPAPAAGFALGIERLLGLLEQEALLPPPASPHACILPVGEAAAVPALLLAERLRDELPALRLETLCGGGGMKSLFRRADRSGARYALVLGADEMAADSVSVKDLRGDAGQETIPADRLSDWLAARIQA